MEYGAIVALLVGALFGILLASRHFLRLKLPVWAAVFHGLAGATGFTLLLVTVLANPTFTLARRALIILVIAVFMGCVNVVFHIRGLRHRTGLILGHALLAVSGVTTFAFALATRRPPAMSPQEGVRPPGIDSRETDRSIARTLTPPSDATPARAAGTAPTLPAAALAAAAGLRAVRSTWADAAWRVEFESASATLSPGSRETIQHVADALRAEPRIRYVEVQGYADERGDDGNNVALTRARAGAVVDALVALGADRATLSAAGYGARCPSEAACTPPASASTCHDPSAWARDRRVTFAVLQVDTELYSGVVACERASDLIPKGDERFSARRASR
jgi:outer membrane protein OmpA-like peptidoglycan-associated protein